MKQPRWLANPAPPLQLAGMQELKGAGMGAFTASERGCDFYVGEVRRYAGSQNVILAAYADQPINDSLLQAVFIQ
jgi:hypothetical protein